MYKVNSIIKKVSLQIVFTMFLTFVGNFSTAQDKIKITEEDYGNQEIEMADSFRADGKIYVLTGIILIVVIGMIFYLVVIDKKVAKLEKQLPDNEG